MARPLRSFPVQNLPIFCSPLASLCVVIAGVLSVFSIVTFLCGSHSVRKEQRTVRLGDKRPLSRLRSDISSRALSMVKLISWKKVQDEEEEEEEEDDDEALWKRTIIMGEKCRPLDFSGKILYDSDGNLLPASPRDDQTMVTVSGR